MGYDQQRKCLGFTGFGASVREEGVSVGILSDGLGTVLWGEEVQSEVERRAKEADSVDCLKM